MKVLNKDTIEDHNYIICVITATAHASAYPELISLEEHETLKAAYKELR